MVKYVSPSSRRKPEGERGGEHQLGPLKSIVLYSQLKEGPSKDTSTQNL